MKQGSGHITTRDGFELFYRYSIPEKPLAVMIIVHGYAEHSGRYLELMHALGERRIAAFAQNLRGHGQEAKVLADLDSADAALEDIQPLQKKARELVPEVPLFMMGHSFGAALAILHSLKNPQAVRGLVVTAPFIQLPEYASPFLVKVSGLLSKLFPLLPAQSFDYSQASRDPAVVQKLDQDPFYYKGKIRIRTGYEMLRTIDKARSGINRLQMPLLILYGTEDKLVNTSDSKYMFEHAASKDKTLKAMTGLYHEILNEPEKEEVRDLIIDWILGRSG